MSRIVLWDASALLRLLWPAARTSEVQAARDRQLSAGDDLRVVIHTLRECYATLTRSIEANGYEIPPNEASEAIQALLAANAIALVPDPPDAYALWLNLCERTATKGILCHDAYLAACALALDVPVYALDRDFARFGVRTV